MNQIDTIAAVATPLGSGAVGIVRLSGAQALRIAQACFVSGSGKRLEDMPGYTALLGRIVGETGEIDEAILTVFRAPKSYTGEDCVELSCHGGTYVLQEVLAACVKQGARPAMPGEFTRRAFLNGKLNLVQAEAVCDLIAAQGEGARRAALASRDGALSTEIEFFVESLAAQSAHLAAWADYPEEDLAPVDPSALSIVLRRLADRMDALLSTYSRGRLLREGIETAIVGKPNVGKSSLMNLLAGARRSIVAALPGTTRDIVRESVRVGEYILHLMDTAGIRDTKDPVESQGVSLARERMKSAQLVLAVFDSSDVLEEEDRGILGELADQNVILVVNKSDLPRRLQLEEIREQFSRVVHVSAQTGEGREELEKEIIELLQLDTLDAGAALLANSRQQHAVQSARNALEEAIEALQAGMTLDAVNVCIDDTLEQLLTITGQRASDKVVDEVFARFCVGK